MTKRNSLKARRIDRSFILQREGERKARAMKKKAKKVTVNTNSAMKTDKDAAMSWSGADAAIDAVEKDGVEAKPAKLSKGARRRLHRSGQTRVVRILTGKVKTQQTKAKGDSDGAKAMDAESSSA